MKDIRDYLSYDPLTGVFVWIKPNGLNKANKVGTVAGSVKASTGYRSIEFDGHYYRANRLAWFFVYGEFPVERLDHHNRKRDDNRIENLRLATSSQNAMNRGSRKGSLSKHKGVTYHKQNRCWQAQIKVDGKNKYLGVFDTEDDAAKAYDQAAVRAHGEFACLNGVPS